MKLIKFLLIILITTSSLNLKGQSKTRAEKPYKIHEKGMYMSRVDIRKELRGIENSVQIAAMNMNGGVGLVSGEILPGAEITSITATQGSYNMSRQINKSGRGETIQITDVIFPVRLRITVSQQYLDVEIKEEGFWKISVLMTK